MEYFNLQMFAEDGGEAAVGEQTAPSGEQTGGADSIYGQWMDQARQTQQLYPSFDLRTELSTPMFQKLLVSGVDAKTAYEVLHRDEILPAAMRYTAETVEKGIANKLMSNASRPAENGTRNLSSAVTKTDVSRLSRAERRDIAKRVARGEKIQF